MQTLYRATVMLVSLAGLGWAFVEYAPPQVVQPAARLVVEWIDRRLVSQNSEPERSTTGPFLPIQALDYPLRARSAAADTQDQVVSPDPPALLQVEPEPGEAQDEPQPGSELPAFVDASEDAPAGGSSGATTGTPAGDSMWSRLVQLGAVGHTVEPWGQNGLYRSSCRVPLDESSLLMRHFEATAATPESAIREVARQVEIWRRERNG